MGLANIQAIDLRQFTEDTRRTTDDYPYGGGTGMVMKLEPILRGIRHVKKFSKRSSCILFDASG